MLASYYRLITIDYKINFDQCVQMLESIYRYAVTNQKGKDVGRVIFAIHDACDAKYHLDNGSLSFPFQMKNVKENVQFLEYTSPTTIVNPSTLSNFPDDPITVYVTKRQLEVVEYITKCTGQFLKDLMSILSNDCFLL